MIQQSNEPKEVKRVELKNLLHQRILCGEKGGYHNSSTVFAQEYKVLEISPSNEWIKLQNLDGRKYWKRTAEIVLLEVLEIIQKPKD